MIDNSSAWRMDPDVPLVVPEVNAEAAKGFVKQVHHRQPQLLDRPARRGAEAAARPRAIKRVVVATYQSVSGAGKEAMDELFAQTRAVFVSDPVEPKKFPKRIAFNLIPQIDVFMDDGSTKEEWKMVAETKKILDPKIKLTATCVRVPVFISHSEAVNIEFEKPISADEARDILREAPGCLVDRPARARRLHHPARGGGRGRDLHQPHPRGPDGRERPQPLVRLRQSAQGRGAERGADRRGAGQPRLAQAEGEGGVRATAALRVRAPCPSLTR